MASPSPSRLKCSLSTWAWYAASSRTARVRNGALLTVALAEAAAGGDDGCRAAAAAAAGKGAGPADRILGYGGAVVQAITVETGGDVVVLEDVAHDEFAGDVQAADGLGLAGEPARPGDGVLHRGGEAVLGCEAVVEGDDEAVARECELAKGCVISLGAYDETAAMQVEKGWQLPRPRAVEARGSHADRGR
jgi:hypothetical protein